MNPLNFSPLEAFQFNLLTNDEIEENLREHEHLVNILIETLDTADPNEIIQIIDQKDQEITDLQDQIESTESEFIQQIREAYEYRHGKVFDTPLETLAQWVCEDIRNAPDPDE